MTGKLFFGIPVPALITAELVQQMHGRIDEDEYCCHALERTAIYLESSHDHQTEIVHDWVLFLGRTGIGTGGSGFALVHTGRDPDITDLISAYGGDSFNADMQRRKIFLTKLAEVLSE